jgi:hypothetical protein
MFWNRFTPTFEIAIFQNHVRVKNCRSDEIAERPAVYPFSSSSMLIANQDYLEEELKQLIRQVAGTYLFIFPNARVVELQKPLEPVEREALRNALLNGGFSKVFLPDDENRR